MITTVIFDIGNVLARFTWKEHFASFSYDENTLDKLAKATVESPDWCEYDLGILSDEEILNLFIENDPSIERELTESMKNIGTMLTRCDYAIPWIEQLKADGYRTLFLSNFSEKALREGAAGMDFVPHLDGGIFSYQVNLIKPNPAIYKLLLSQYGLVPEECVFLDDTLANVEAAAALGIHAIHFQNVEQAKRELRKELLP